MVSFSLSEATESNCTEHFIIKNMAHTKLILSSKIVNILNKIIMNQIN